MTSVELTGKFHLDHIAAPDGWYSNNFYVYATRVKTDIDSIDILFDLSGNLTTKNSSASEDYPSLSKRIGQITTLQVKNANFRKRLSSKLKLHSRLSRFVTLVLAGGISERYYATFASDGEDGVKISLSKS